MERGAAARRQLLMRRRIESAPTLQDTVRDYRRTLETVADPEPIAQSLLDMFDTFVEDDLSQLLMEEGVHLVLISRNPPACLPILCHMVQHVPFADWITQHPHIGPFIRNYSHLAGGRDVLAGLAPRYSRLLVSYPDFLACSDELALRMGSLTENDAILAMVPGTLNVRVCHTAAWQHAVAVQAIQFPSLVPMAAQIAACIQYQNGIVKRELLNVIDFG